VKYNNKVMHRAGYGRQITGRVSSETECHIGPRGNKTSVFDVYFRDKKTQEPVRIFTYEGMEELDYSIFTEKCIYFFEGKNFPGGEAGWTWAGTRSLFLQAGFGNIRTGAWFLLIF